MVSSPLKLPLLFATCFACVIFTTLASLYDPPKLVPQSRKISDTEVLISTKSIADYNTYYYEQTLDHFNYRPKSYSAFRQRYLINDKNWGGPNTNSPMLVHLGPEQSIDIEVDIIGFLDDNAPQLKALIVFIEHRYQGESIPKGPIEKVLRDKENRGYFNSAQALADFAEIILYLKTKLSARYSPVIVSGGSYGGMLAAWFRLKYPHIALGALASSAPVLLHSIKSPYVYFDWASKDFKDTSETCYQTIKQSWVEFDKLASQPNGFSALTRKFKLCSDLKSKNEVDKLKVKVARQLGSVAQYDAPPEYPVRAICNVIDGAPNDTHILDKIAAAFDFYKGRQNCYSIASQPSQVTLAWRWQECSEDMVSGAAMRNHSMFPEMLWDHKDFMSNCKHYWGVPTRPSWLDIYYGGPDLKLALQKFGSNIIFSNGLRDPLSQLGVLEDLSDTLLAIHTKEGSHCLDLLRSSKSDPEWLNMLRQKETAIIHDWLANYYVDLRAYLPGSK